MLMDFISDAKKGDIQYFFPPAISDKNNRVQEFYSKSYQNKKRQLGIITYGLVPLFQKDLFRKLYSNQKDYHMKYVTFPVPGNIGILNNKVVIISWGDKPKGILINIKDIAYPYKEYFLSIWDSIK